MKGVRDIVPISADELAGIVNALQTSRHGPWIVEHGEVAATIKEPFPAVGFRGRQDDLAQVVNVAWDSVRPHCQSQRIVDRQVIAAAEKKTVQLVLDATNVQVITDNLA